MNPHEEQSEFSEITIADTNGGKFFTCCGIGQEIGLRNDEKSLPREFNSRRLQASVPNTYPLLQSPVELPRRIAKHLSKEKLIEDNARRDEANYSLGNFDENNRRLGLSNNDVRVQRYKPTDVSNSSLVLPHQKNFDLSNFERQSTTKMFSNSNFDELIDKPKFATTLEPPLDSQSLLIPRHTSEVSEVVNNHSGVNTNECMNYISYEQNATIVSPTKVNENGTNLGNNEIVRPIHTFPVHSEGESQYLDTELLLRSNDTSIFATNVCDKRRADIEETILSYPSFINSSNFIPNQVEDNCQHVKSARIQQSTQERTQRLQEYPSFGSVSLFQADNLRETAGIRIEKHNNTHAAYGRDDYIHESASSSVVELPESVGLVPTQMIKTEDAVHHSSDTSANSTEQSSSGYKCNNMNDIVRIAEPSTLATPTNCFPTSTISRCEAEEGTRKSSLSDKPPETQAEPITYYSSLKEGVIASKMSQKEEADNQMTSEEIFDHQYSVKEGICGSGSNLLRDTHYATKNITYTQHGRAQQIYDNTETHIKEKWADAAQGPLPCYEQEIINSVGRTSEKETRDLENSPSVSDHTLQTKQRFPQTSMGCVIKSQDGFLSSPQLGIDKCARTESEITEETDDNRIVKIVTNTDSGEVQNCKLIPEVSVIQQTGLSHKLDQRERLRSITFASDTQLADAIEYKSSNTIAEMARMCKAHSPTDINVNAANTRASISLNTDTLINCVGVSNSTNRDFPLSYNNVLFRKPMDDQLGTRSTPSVAQNVQTHPEMVRRRSFSEAPLQRDGSQTPTTNRRSRSVAVRSSTIISKHECERRQEISRATTSERIIRPETEGFLAAEYGATNVAVDEFGEYVIRRVERPVVETVTKEVHKVEERVNVVEQIVHTKKYIDRIVPKPQIVEREHRVQVPRIRERIVEKKVVHKVDRPVEIVQEIPVYQYTDKVVSVPGKVVKVPIAKIINQTILKPKFMDKKVPVVVAQSFHPFLSETSNDCIDMECRIIQFTVSQLDVFLPKVVKRSMVFDSMVTRHHSVGKVPSPQYNALVKQLNPSLDFTHGAELFNFEPKRSTMQSSYYETEKGGLYVGTGVGSHCVKCCEDQIVLSNRLTVSAEHVATQHKILTKDMNNGNLIRGEQTTTHPFIQPAMNIQPEASLQAESVLEGRVKEIHMLGKEETKCMRMAEAFQTSGNQFCNDMTQRFSGKMTCGSAMAKETPKICHTGKLLVENSGALGKKTSSDVDLMGHNILSYRTSEEVIHTNANETAPISSLQLRDIGSKLVPLENTHMFGSEDREYSELTSRESGNLQSMFKQSQQVSLEEVGNHQRARPESTDGANTVDVGHEPDIEEKHVPRGTLLKWVRETLLTEIMEN